MTILVPNNGESIALQYLVNKATVPENLKYQLFSSNTTPAETDTAATYTIVTGGGYADITMTGANWVATPGAPSNVTYNAQQTYTFTGVIGGSGIIYGYIAVRGTTGDIILAETFANFTPTNNGDTVKITPTITAD